MQKKTNRIVLNFSDHQVEVFGEVHKYHAFSSKSATFWALIQKEWDRIKPPDYVRVKQEEIAFRKQKDQTKTPKNMDNISYIYDQINSFILPIGFKLPKEIDKVKITNRNEFTQWKLEEPKFVICRGDAWDLEFHSIPEAKMMTKKEVERHTQNIQDPSFLPPKEHAKNLFSSNNYYIWRYVKSKAYNKETALKLFL